ncbi:CpsD/CapB family tyrosine-protein kinase [Granulicella mallensis]|uniref:Cobyrinic acid ac-diamide synthase n=1 Tax=Granulicella mallensis (strain ATCC BAA-1857 / DSM 23137 / MP5ACTX8) TaxID=682795 RepID=G8NXD3_GRAMM|nr:CpsD/CapB family tyrosine-protein kinase [Granulicella mallensis]AEU37840.1 Cobyrinic acid ac-diamide synthase [Granulicella mallensis MP5ACTX8]
MITLNLREYQTIEPHLMIASASNGDAGSPHKHQNAVVDRPASDQSDAINWLNMVPKLERLPQKHRTTIAFESGADSRACEQFRLMQHRLVTARPAGGVVLITSPSAEDGKSLNCQNLAWALAEAGHKTLLLDLDLRRPSLLAALGGVCPQSIEQVLKGEVTPEAAIRSVGDLPLYIIGLDKAVSKPVPLLRAPELSNLLKWAQKNFQWVLLDAPPVLPVADVEQLLPSADLVLMVVRERVTRRAAVQRAAEMLGEHLSSLIFNDVTMSIAAGYGANYDRGYR